MKRGERAGLRIAVAVSAAAVLVAAASCGGKPEAPDLAEYRYRTGKRPLGEKVDFAGRTALGPDTARILTQFNQSPPTGPDVAYTIDVDFDLTRKVRDQGADQAVTTEVKDVKGDVEALGGKQKVSKKASNAVGAGSSELTLDARGEVVDVDGAATAVGGLPGADPLTTPACPVLPKGGVAAGDTWKSREPLPGFALVGIDVPAENRYVGGRRIGGEDAVVLESRMRTHVDAKADLRSAGMLFGIGGAQKLPKALETVDLRLRGDISLRATCALRIEDGEAELLQYTLRGTLDLTYSAAGGEGDFAAQFTGFLNGIRVWGDIEVLAEAA